MSFPLLFTVGVHAYTGTGEDAHGNVIPQWAPAKDQPGTSHAVYGWSVPSTTEPKLLGHDERVIVDVELLVPPGFPTSERDLIDLPDGPAGQFEVVGVVQDYTKGPFGFRPGAVLNLRKVAG